MPPLPSIPSNKNQDPAHVMDFPSLNLGHSPCSKQIITLVDLEVNVYGLEEIKGSTKPVAVIIVSHGWANKAAQMENMAHGLVGDIARLSKQGGAARDVLVVTVDQRNHGVRRNKAKPDQLAYKNNPWRLTGMTTSLKGGVYDHQLIMDMLASFLFPKGERTIDEFMVTGVSLGGHVDWRLMEADKRIRVAVPIISIPADALYLVHTATFRADGTLGKEVHYPAAVKDFYERVTPAGTYAGRKILALHGSVDQVVPPAFGEESWARVVRDAGEQNTDRWVQDGRGHVCSPEMVERAAEWFYRWGISPQGVAGAQDVRAKL